MDNIEFKFICTSDDDPLYLYTDEHIDKKQYEEEVIKEFVGIIEEPLKVKHGYVNRYKDTISNAPRENFSPITYIEV